MPELCAVMTAYSEVTLPNTLNSPNSLSPFGLDSCGGLTFKNRPIYRTGVPLPSKCCILYIFSTNISTEYFKHAANSPFFSSKCRLFHNATFFGSCIIRILHTECAKI